MGRKPLTTSGGDLNGGDVNGLDFGDGSVPSLLYGKSILTGTVLPNCRSGVWLLSEEKHWFSTRDREGHAALHVRGVQWLQVTSSTSLRHPRRTCTGSRRDGDEGDPLAAPEVRRSSAMKALRPLIALHPRPRRHGRVKWRGNTTNSVDSFAQCQN